MPKDLSAGHSEGTRRKYEDFEAFQWLHWEVFDKVTARNEWASDVYHYVDLNAGPGRVNGMIGSPLLFLENAIRRDCPWQAWFCEIDPDSADCLDAEVAVFEEFQRGANRVMAMDHRLAIPDIAQQIGRGLRGQKALGLIFADPNGLISAEVESIRYLCAGHPKLDVLIHLSATTIKRCAGAFGYARTSERLKMVGKRSLLIRVPREDWQWTFALLTDMPKYPEWKARGFHDSESPRGREIMNVIEYTAAMREAEQGKEQLTLW